MAALFDVMLRGLRDTGFFTPAADTAAALALKAPLASPAFTGTPTAPTAALGTNTTQLATTAFAFGVASHAGSGYQTLPSGLIIQWGTAVKTTAGNMTITLPVAFSSTAYTAIVAGRRASGTVTAFEIVRSLSTTQLVVAGDSAAADYYVNWVAIGK